MVKLISYTKNYQQVLSKAAAVCHDNKEVLARVIQHIIDSGHLSVLEHCSATFEIEISRKVLAQITRHRHLSFTVQSSRACVLTSNVYVGDSEVDESLDKIMAIYHEALEKGVPFDRASYLLPEGAMCRVVVTGNFRAWLEMLPKRTCNRALLEFRKIADEIYDKLHGVAPEIFTAERKKSCGKCTEKSCEFK